MQKHIRTQLIGILLVFIYLAIMMAGGIDTITGYVSSAKCGNYVCETEENYATCPTDCVGTCGNNICEQEETHTCVMDCREARSANIEEKAFSVGATWIVFAASTAVLIIGIALIGNPKKRTRRRKRKLSRRK